MIRDIRYIANNFAVLSKIITVFEKKDTNIKKGYEILSSLKFEDVRIGITRYLRQRLSDHLIGDLYIVV
ncbi:hypothetical protein ECANGB1_255 [Enterospora canceri]|uniref:Uncharacterized protein n=1 Tax=Enterospora canceri TaxID=1081671 RepID=A0A1Y1S4I6_9MICR|nr:hypothetical protein ECANGB1_255 [Enterospora canceri]